MRAVLSRLSAEGWLVGGLFVLSLELLSFMNVLVAKPKLLFGRSLNAIEPTLFPTLVLVALAAIAAGILVAHRRTLVIVPKGGKESGQLILALQFFAVMVFYALTMVPFGFLISSAIALGAISWLAGNRSLIQIAAVAIVSPILLYIVATRGLAVSLPELSPIEFAYAWVFNR